MLTAPQKHGILMVKLVVFFPVTTLLEVPPHGNISNSYRLLDSVHRLKTGYLGLFEKKLRVTKMFEPTMSGTVPAPIYLIRSIRNSVDQKNCAQ